MQGWQRSLTFRASVSMDQLPTVAIPMRLATLRKSDVSQATMISPMSATTRLMTLATLSDSSLRWRRQYAIRRHSDGCLPFYAVHMRKVAGCCLAAFLETTRSVGTDGRK